MFQNPALALLPAFEAPRGGITVKWARTGLATQDGYVYVAGWCACKGDDIDQAYYEWVGPEAGDRQGQHGWFHTAAECRRITQVG